MRRLALPAAAVASMASLAGCYYDSDCAPTRVVAQRADKVNLGAAARSAVVTATLTAGGTPLPGRTLTFDVLDDGSSVYDDDARTGADGSASVDLKRADPAAIVAVVRADHVRASFAGDSAYCASSDDAAFRAVRS